MFTAQKLIYCVHTELLNTIFNYKTCFANEIKQFIENAKQFQNTKFHNIVKNGDNVDWKQLSQDKDNLISSIFNFVSSAEAYKQVIPEEAIRAASLHQYATILLIKTFFAEEVTKCAPINQECSNLSSLHSYVHFIESFIVLEHFSYICAQLYPITFLNLILMNHPNLDIACEYYVKSNQSDSQCSSELSLIVANVKLKFLIVQEE